jgi:integrase
MLKLGRVGVLTPAQGRDMAKETLADVTHGEDPADTRRRARCSTLREYLDVSYGPWLLDNRKAGSAMLGRLRAGCADLLDKKLADVNPWAIEQWRSPYIKRGAIVSANRHLAYLRSALSRAVEWRVIKSNPIAGVKCLKEDHARQGQIRTLSPEEEARLWTAVDAREDRLRSERDRGNLWRRTRGLPEIQNLRKVAYADFGKPFITLALHSGLRRGELFAAEWRDVDLDKAILTVRAEVAKSGKTRYVPLNAIVLECLRKWREQSSGEGILFPSPQGGGKLTSVKRLWAVLMREAGIDGVRLHDLRHTFCSRLLQAGVDAATVRDLAGHSNLSITTLYLHSDPASRIAAVAKLAMPESNVIPLTEASRKAIGTRGGKR